MFRPDSTLTFNNAKAVLDSGLRAIANGQATIDLGDVTAVDSAAAATLIAWQRAAREKRVTLAFLNTPANLCSLLELYGVVDLLPTDSPNEAFADLLHH